MARSLVGVMATAVLATLGFGCSSDPVSSARVCDDGGCVDVDASNDGTDVGGTPDAAIDADLADGDVPDDVSLDGDGDAVACEDCAVDADCGADSFCFDGCCESTSECSTPGDRCVDASQATLALECVTELQKCLPRCSMVTDSVPTFGGCSSGSRCSPYANARTETTLDGFCVPGECRADTDCPGGERCLPAGNDSGYCGAIGAADDGDSCVFVTDCAEGLVCFGGDCVASCSTASAEDCPGSTCVHGLGTIGGVGFGICAPACTPGAGDCADGTQCRPIGRNDGYHVWACLEGAGTLDVGQPCTEPGSCRDGLACQRTFAGDDMSGECVEVCDVNTGAGCDIPGQSCVGIPEENRATCRYACDPYPDVPGEFGCPQSSQTCLAPTPGVFTAPAPYCIDEPGDTVAGEPCSTSDDCADLGLCDAQLATEELTCRARCPLFAAGGCPEGEFCRGDSALYGYGGSACATPPAPWRSGDICDDIGFPCADDSTVCLPDARSSVPICRTICRLGEPYRDCDELQPGLTCRDVFSPGLYHPGLGACAP